MIGVQSMAKLMDAQKDEGDGSFVSLMITKTVMEGIKNPKIITPNVPYENCSHF